ncbi:unnamed protein product [Pleuronectes platessa]|uniref:E3 ubiquitin-protein ligase TRIM32 n=1 Tax=Pleuronectes platessa TaxID=8262 RepID=A0A9N7TVQ6_PLEPL|nr:unnamed protein product [Pleuronectes platessa]
MFVGTPFDCNPNSPNPAHSPSPDCQSDNSSPTFLPQTSSCWATQARCDLAQAEAELRRLQERHATETESVKRGVERAILGARREERRLQERVEQDHRDTQQRLEQVLKENMAAVRVSQSLLEQRLFRLTQLQQQMQGIGQQPGLDQSGHNHNLLLKEEIQCEDKNDQGAAGEKGILGQGWTSPTGRVIRKISLSTRSDLESEEEQKASSRKTCPWLQQSDWESSQDDDMESASFQQQGEDVYLVVPTVLPNKDTEVKEQVYKVNSNGKHYSPRNQRRSRSLVSGRKLSHSRERRHTKLGHYLSLDSQEGDKGKVSRESKSRLLGYGNIALSSPRLSPREPLTSQSCLDLTSRGRPHSHLSQSSDENSLGTLGDSGRAPSPTDSLDSNYTFIVSPSHDYSMNRGSLNYNGRLSKSAVDLTHNTRPLISGGSNNQEGGWRVKCNKFNSMSSSTSPVLDGFSQEPKRGRGERGEPALVELEEEGDPSFTAFNPRGAHLIRQFGKQGSGRADLTLPSGIHATSQGQLFIVDCGNARIQVTDPRGNVVQQVISPTSDGSARRCRNYFDIAVNAKGLIALSCAAERALLVFSRHGRLLQTFGGSGLGSAKDELEAPRGVTVTRVDEFLVADIRKGTLIALKLEPKTGSRLERTVVTGFHRPYLVAACLSSGLIAVSERGNETGRVPCIKVLEPGWNTVRILGVCAGMGPVLVCPWGICVDTDGNVLVVDWGEVHRVLLYPAHGAGWPIVTQGLSSPRGLTLLPEGQLAVSDSMHHCVKIYQYKEIQG